MKTFIISLFALFYGIVGFSQIVPGSPNNFVTVWNTENTTSITIPAALPPFAVQYDLYWEQENNPSINGTLTFQSGNALINGLTANTNYKVEITGIFPRIIIFNLPANNRTQIRQVVQWGTIGWLSMENAFRGASKMDVIATDAPNLNNVTNFSHMFRGCSSLIGASANWNWNTSTATTMLSMFQEAALFNQSLSNWNVSNVTTFREMFRQATNFNQPLNNWNLNSCADISGMFLSASNFNQPLNNWNTAGVTTMVNTFFGTSFNQNISQWNVENVISMTGMFASTSAFNQPLNSWNTQNLSNISNMFTNAAVFNQPLHNWNTSNLTLAISTFANNHVFNQNIENWNTASVVNMSGMFNMATAFNQPLGNWNVGNVTNMEGMFMGASVFNQPLNNWDVSNVTTMSNMFAQTNAFNQPLNNWDTQNLTIVEQMFENASAFNQSLGNWDISSFSSCNHMFSYSGMSCTNYSLTLDGWSKGSSVPTTIIIDAIGISYNTFGQAAKWDLINTYNWYIDDDGLYNNCFSAMSNENFITLWNTQIDNFITIPTIGTGYNYSIYWEAVLDPNDNGFLSAQTGTITLPNLTTSTIYRVEIAGLFPRFYHSLLPTNERSKLREITQWGSIPWESMNEAFAFASNLNVSATDVPYLNNVASLSHMFRFCISLSGIGANWQWNTSHITTMEGAFYFATIFNQDISNWNTALVSNFENMFFSATIFNQDISNWQTSNAINMGYMFSGATAFNQPIGGWNTNNVTNMEAMFSSAASFNQALNNWNVSNVTNMLAMFNGATAFNMPINSWQVNNVQNMQAMFANTDAFNQNLSGWNVSNVSNLASMFSGAIAFNQNIGNWQLNSATTINNMLNNCGLDCNRYTATLIGWANNNNTPNNLILSANGIFYNQIGVSVRNSLINTKNWQINNDNLDTSCFSPGSADNFITVWNTRNSTNFTIPTIGVGYDYQVYWEEENNPSNNGFYIAQNGNITISNLTAFTSYKVEIKGVFPRINMIGLGNLERPKLYKILQWGTIVWSSMENAFRSSARVNLEATDTPNLSQVSSLKNMFSGCTLLNGNTANWAWNSQNVTDMSGMFQGCSFFLGNTSLNNFNTQNVTNMSSVFNGCLLFNININNWNTGNVTNINDMFQNCVVFNQPLNNWFTFNVNTANNLFYNAKAFNQPLDDWNTENITSMAAMFNLAESFNQPLSTWKVGAVTSFGGMFSGAHSFNQALNDWDVSSAIDFTYMFESAYQFNQPLYNWDVSTGSFFYNMFQNSTAFDQDLGDWNLENVTDLTDFFSNSGMSCINYSLTLWGWSENPNLPNSISLDAHGIVYGELGASAHIYLSTTKNWFISDDGYTSDCLIVGEAANFITTWNTKSNTHLTIPTFGNGFKYDIFWQEALNPSISGYIYDNTGNTTISGLKQNTLYFIDIAGRFPRFKHNELPNTEYLKLQSVNNWGKIKWESMEYAFQFAAELDILATDVPNLTEVDNLSHMFDFCLNLSGSSANWNWNTSKVNNMSYLFLACANFNQDLNNWNVEQVTDMSYIFGGAALFNQPLDQWNTANVTNLSFAFSAAHAFNEPINNWDVSKVTNMQAMFLQADEFNQPLDMWDVSNVTDMSSMFFNANDFNQDLGNWVLNPNVTLHNTLSETGLDCDNYSLTLSGWVNNNQFVVGRTLGAANLVYNLNGQSARNTLTQNRSWIITDQGLAGEIPFVIPENNNLIAINSCDAHYLNPQNLTQKVVSIMPNGNTFLFDSTQVLATNQFLPNLPVDVSTHTGNGAGYYQINNTGNTFRVSRRMFSINAPGIYPINGGVLVRIYFDPNDTLDITNATSPNGNMTTWGWFKMDVNSFDDVVNNMQANNPALTNATLLTPNYGTENGTNYAEFLVESFSTIGFFAATFQQPLPVDLINLNVINYNCQPVLFWETAAELNFDYFDIAQLFSDGTHHSIGKINGKAYLGNGASYQFELPQLDNTYFVYLKSVDLDGSYKQSKIMQVNTCKKTKTIEAFPNPFTNYFSFFTHKSGVLSITQSDGKLVKQQYITDTGNHQIDLSSFSDGLYFVHWADFDGKITILKMVKQN